MLPTTPHHRESEHMIKEQEQIIADGRWIAIVNETMKAMDLEEAVKAERVAAERAALEMALEGKYNLDLPAANDAEALPPLPVDIDLFELDEANAQFPLLHMDMDQSQAA